MEILKNPVMAAKAKACHAKGCKKYGSSLGCVV